MKQKLITALATLTVMALMPTVALAKPGCSDCKKSEDYKKDRPQVKQESRKGHPHGQSKKREWTNPDTNGDMLVDEAEADAAIDRVVDRMKAHFKERNEKVLEHFDKDGDGKLSEEEKELAKEKMEKRSGRGKGFRKQMLEKFDADGDGTLSEEEREAARDAMQKKRGGRRGPKGRDPGSDE